MADTLLQQKLQQSFASTKHTGYLNASIVRKKFLRNSSALLQINKLDTGRTDTRKPDARQKRLTDFSNLMAVLENGILDNNAMPSHQLIALSDYLDLKHEKDLLSLTNAWEKFFLRHATTGEAIERWDLQRLGLGEEWEERRHNIIELLKTTGLLATKMPAHKQYDTLIIHGSRLEDIMPRLQYIAQFWINGGRFKNIVVLTGERILTADERDQNSWLFVPYKQTYKASIMTEIDLMQYAWRVNNIIPPAVRALPVAWINTPNFISNYGRMRRGNTEDTINAWINSQLSAQQYDLGKCLAVANAPLILRQDLVFERKLYERGIAGSIETVGLAEAEPGTKRVIYYLREISGLLWELNKLASEISI